MLYALGIQITQSFRHSSDASSDASRPTTLDKPLRARTGVAFPCCRAAWPRLRRRRRRDAAQRAKVGLALLRIAGAGRPRRWQRPGIPAVRPTRQALPCTPPGASVLQSAGGPSFRAHRLVSTTCLHHRHHIWNRFNQYNNHHPHVVSITCM